MSKRNTKFSYEEVKNIFEDGGCKLLDKTYVNARTPLEYMCSCGNVSKINLWNFKKGQRCNECGTKRTAKKRKLTYEEVKEVFKSNDCELLSSSYKDAYTKLKYKCSCGNISEILFHSFKKGHRCMICSHERITKKISGVNSLWYNPNLSDEDRIDRRLIPGYNKWVRNVYKRDYWTCQCCKKKKGVEINAHHKEGYAENKNLRIAVSNGITLCDTCHRNFHSIYGKKNNTSSQLEEFLLDFAIKILNDDKIIVSV